ncbi:MAG: RluA family pseudouridine synthase [Candidatus Nomurabacteria bacterium]|nr:RluA family pseudouridine synthase [Candidatus Nomurabacteria bacterium]
MHIPVIFEDTNIVVLNKPSGIVMHPFDNSTEETLVDFLMKNYPNMFDIENQIILQDCRTINLGGIVHKLDRETSGVIVVAKNKEIFNELRKQFINHSIEKTYLAVLEGIVKENNFVIDAPLGRNKKDYKQQVNPTNPRGELRSAVTGVEVIKRKENITIVKLNPKTGRTHQLRAHMTYIMHPIVGDIVYGSKIQSERIMLHALNLKFKIGDKDFEFEVEAPDDFLD